MHVTHKSSQFSLRAGGELTTSLEEILSPPREAEVRPPTLRLSRLPLPGASAQGGSAALSLPGWSALALHFNTNHL